MSGPRFLCLSVPDLDLQLVQRRENIPPDAPLLIVESDRPSARVLACNAAAAQLGVGTGIRYSAALSRSGTIRAGVVAEHERAQVVAEIRALLGELVPGVEVWRLNTTVFWGDVRGMAGLGVGSSAWFRTLSERISRGGWSGGVSLGWTRPGTFCAAREAAIQANMTPDRCCDPAVRDAGSVRVFSSLDAELRWYRSCSLDHLPLTGRDRERLALLGLRRVGDLLAIREELWGGRLSAHLREVHRFLQRATGDMAVRDAVEQSTIRDTQGHYEPPLRSIAALLGACMELVRQVLPELAEQGRWIRHLRLSCTDDREQRYTEAIECGHLTRDPDYLQRLITLRLENRSWRAREIASITLSVGTEDADTRQKTLDDLFEESSSMNTERIDETLAYIRARLGNDRVFCVRLHPGRLPEHRFRRVAIASVRELSSVRERPADKDGGPREDGAALPDGVPPGAALPDGVPPGAAVPGGVPPEGPPPDGSSPDRVPPVTRIRRIRATGPAPFRFRVPPLSYGPFVQAGEWWERDETDRMYSYHRRNGGEMLWLYRSVHGGPWMVQGYLA